MVDKLKDILVYISSKSNLKASVPRAKVAAAAKWGAMPVAGSMKLMEQAAARFEIVHAGMLAVKVKGMSERNLTRVFKRAPGSRSTSIARGCGSSVRAI
jgi:hypothetical protein